MRLFICLTFAATCSSGFYYIQMMVVPYHLVHGTTEGLALWLYAYDYPYDIPGALEAVGYSFVSVSFLFAAQVFGKEKLPQWVRSAFVEMGLIGLPLFIDPLFRLPLIFLLIDAVANAVLGILAPVLLAVLFRRSMFGRAMVYNGTGKL